MDIPTDQLLREGSMRLIFEADAEIHLKDLRKFLELYELAGKKLCTLPRMRDCAEIVFADSGNSYQQLNDYLRRKNIFLKELLKKPKSAATQNPQVIPFAPAPPKKVAAKSAARPTPQAAAMKPSFDPIIQRISYNSPLEIAMFAIPTILVSGVILAGGEVDIDFKNMKFTGRCNSLLVAIKKLTKAFKKKN